MREQHLITLTNLKRWTAIFKVILSDDSNGTNTNSMQFHLLSTGLSVTKVIAQNIVALEADVERFFALLNTLQKFMQLFGLTYLGCQDLLRHSDISTVTVGVERTSIINEASDDKAAFEAADAKRKTIMDAKKKRGKQGA